MRRAEYAPPPAVVPTALPTPPTVRAKSELVARLGRWAQLRATLTSVDETGSHESATLTLQDGTPVFIPWLISSSLPKHWAELIGQPVSVISRVKELPANELLAGGVKAGGVGYALVGEQTICAGEVERFRMDKAPRR